MLNCRESLPEAAVYAAALARQQPQVLANVDRFVVPSRYAAGQVARLGLPAERVSVIPHYLPDEAFAERSSAGAGAYALLAARLSVEKGIDTAIEAAVAAGVPLRIAGDGPARAELAELTAARDAPVELLGRLDRAALDRELAGAAMLLLPSRYHEFAGYSALEAMAAGVPVIATSLGAPPELVGPERCVPPNDARALAARMAGLWESRKRRSEEGEELLERANRRHREPAYRDALLALYEGTAL